MFSYFIQWFKSVTSLFIFMFTLSQIWPVGVSESRLLLTCFYHFLSISLFCGTKEDVQGHLPSWLRPRIISPEPNLPFDDDEEGC